MTNGSNLCMINRDCSKQVKGMKSIGRQEIVLCLIVLTWHSLIGIMPFGGYSKNNIIHNYLIMRNNELKTFGRVMLLALTAVLLTSCHKATFLKVDNNTVKTNIEGTSGDIKIETDGKKVEIAHAPRWVKATVNEEKTVLHYTVELNTDRKLREDSIVLKSSKLTCSIYVRQSFKATYIKMEPDSVSFPIEGGTVEVSVDVDADTPLSVDNMDIAKIEGRKIIITMPRTNSTRSKKKVVKVTCDDISTDLVVTQESGACARCGGSGFLNKPCSYCNGVGIWMCCGYTGKERCPVCNGSGLKRK